MEHFEPEGLREDVARALRVIMNEISGDEGFAEYIVHWLDEDYDPADFGDEVFNLASRTPLWFGGGEVMRVTLAEIVDWGACLPAAELVSGVECWAANRYYLRVRPADYESFNAIYAQRTNVPDFHASTSRALPVSGKLAGIDYECALVSEACLFNLAVTRSGDWDTYHPAILGDEVFVEVRFGIGMSRESVREVATAYVFELAASLHIDVTPDPRAVIAEIEPEEDEEASRPSARLRPLLHGAGAAEVQTLFTSGLGVTDPELQVLQFTKVLEYVSATIVRREMYGEVRAALLRPAALDPDVNFVLELRKIVNSTEVFTRDKEALKLAVRTTCNAVELAKFAPPCLKRLAALGSGSSAKETTAALDELSRSLSATRNRFAHAKANYSPTGDECPREHLYLLATCARVAAATAIRWYASTPEHERVTGV